MSDLSPDATALLEAFQTLAKTDARPTFGAAYQLAGLPFVDALYALRELDDAGHVRHAGMAA